MGRPKAALPLADRRDTLLRRVLRTCFSAGLPEVFVVTGFAADLVRDAAGPPDHRIRFAHNPDWQTGQLSSLLAGIDAASEHLVEAVLVTLVDVPFASVDTFARVLRAWRSTRAPIVRPARDSKHGHPVIFDRAVFDELRSADPQVGAKAVIRAHQHQIVNVTVDDDGAFIDLDTDEDYRAAVARFVKQSSIAPVN